MRVAVAVLLLSASCVAWAAHAGGYYGGLPRPDGGSGSDGGLPRPAPGGGYYGHAPRCAGGYYGGCTSDGRVHSHDVHMPRPKFPTKGPSSPPTGDPCGAQSVDLVLTFDLFDSPVFDAWLPAFTAGLASIVGEPASCISLQLDATRRRSLLTAEQPTVMVFTIRTEDAATTALLLEDASVELAELLKLLGGHLAFYVVRDSQGSDLFAVAVPSTVGAQSVEAAPEAAPAPAEGMPIDPAGIADLLDPALYETMSAGAAPAPAPETLQSSSSAGAVPGKKKSNLAAILGGAIGGGLGALALAAAAFVYLRRRSSATGMPAAFNPAFEGATTAAVTLAPKGGAKFENVALEEVVEATGTPRSARRRKATPFHGGAN